MNFELKSKKLLKLIAVLSAASFLAVMAFLSFRSTIWTEWDYKLLDIVYRQAVKHRRAPVASPRIVYVPITDASYDDFGKNILDRSDMARVNDALTRLGAEAVAYDIIFARPSRTDADRAFQSSVARSGSVYLPIGLAYYEKKKPFRWEKGAAYERFRTDYLRKPAEKGRAHPFYAHAALMQIDALSDAAFNSGHISAHVDPDGVYRHVIMLLKVDDSYFPTLALAMFLDYAGVSLEDVVVHWGEKIVIPATAGGALENDVVIPIDERGRAFIPFVRTWDKDFEKMEAHTLLRHMENEDLRGNLLDFFEGKFVFIGDVSVGTSDLGPIPIEKDVPLIMLHTAMFNALLTNTFYHRTSFQHVAAVLFLIAVLLAASALPRASWPLYAVGLAAFAGLIALTWRSFVGFALFPIASAGGSFLIMFFTLVIGMEAAVSKERAFIKNVFSRYMPQEVVNHLLSRPELLRLGGEERVITVLFSDIQNFTSISEKMPAAALVNLLNRYLTEMTDIVLAEGGVIDKYQGDAVMAEFGVPIAVENHADRAVRTGLKMQRRLEDLRRSWDQSGLPMLHCRIGINTGPMIVGNMGSSRILDYTVIGDAVNLASRLEGANKRYGTFLMISEFTRRSLSPGAFRMRVLDVIKVKGKSEPVKVFEVYAESNDAVAPDDARYFQSYEEGFEVYLARDFGRARDRLQAALSLRPDDIAAKEILSRMDALDPERLPPDWDGSIALTTK
jgi:adenylate cyclase